MNFRRFLIAPLVAGALFLSIGSLYSVSAYGANQNGQAAQPKKPAFQYVCPMHEDVKSKTPGKCPKCKMKLEKRRIKEPEAQPPAQ
jgi:Heavy metal binding domain